MCFVVFVQSCGSSAVRSLSASPATSMPSTSLPSAPSSATLAATRDVSPLIGRTWTVIAATGVGDDHPEWNRGNTLRFVQDKAGAVTLSLTGCETATYPVVFEADQRLTIGRSADSSVCPNPMDLGQSISTVLEMGVRWRVNGHLLTLTPPTRSDISLTMTDQS